MDDCLQQLMDRIDAGEGEQLKNLILSERLAKLVRMRLEMQAPYISKWPQALSIQVCHSILPLGLWLVSLLQSHGYNTICIVLDSLNQQTSQQAWSSELSWLMRFGMQLEMLDQILIGMWSVLCLVVSTQPLRCICWRTILQVCTSPEHYWFPILVYCKWFLAAVLLFDFDSKDWNEKKMFLVH